MRFAKMITTVDSHTEGMATRVITGGYPDIPGKTMAEKRDFAKANLDHLRNAVLNEPRGGEVYGCIMTPPVTEGAAFGAIWMRRGLDAVYSNMCGHATMGVAVTAVEMGLVEVQEPETEIAIDTPAGVVRTIVHVKDGKATSVSLQVVPSFHYRTARVDVPGIGSMTVDIASAGNMIAVVDAGEMGIETTASGVRSARDLIVETIEAINTQVEIDDPEKGPIKASVSALMIGDKPSDPIANVKNVAVTKDLFIDRSPCGTGTSGKLATLHAKGELKVGETVVVESVIGSHFHARLVEEVKVRKKTAVVPELTGRVFITGMHQFTLDPDDPFKHGYLM